MEKRTGQVQTISDEPSQEVRVTNADNNNKNANIYISVSVTKCTRHELKPFQCCTNG